MVLKSRRRLSLAFIILILTISFLSLISLSPSARALSLYNSGDPTPAEQLVLEYINRARANPIAEGQRLGIDIHEGLQDDPQNGCYGPEYVGVRPPLAMNPILLGTARAHSEDMYTQNYFSHSDPNGTSAFQRISNAGYNYGSVGENIGAGTDMTATALEDLLMTDPGYGCRGHRINLLDIFPYPPPAYYEMGVGYYQGPNGQAFITQDFGTDVNTVPFLTGVVYNDANGNNFYDIGEGIAGVTITPSAGSYYDLILLGRLRHPNRNIRNNHGYRLRGWFRSNHQDNHTHGHQHQNRLHTSRLIAPNHDFRALHANNISVDYTNPNDKPTSSNDDIDDANLIPNSDPDLFLIHDCTVTATRNVPVCTNKLRRCNLSGHHHRLREHIHEFSISGRLQRELWSYGESTQPINRLEVRPLELGGRSGLLKRHRKPRRLFGHQLGGSLDSRIRYSDQCHNESNVIRANHAWFMLAWDGVRGVVLYHNIRRHHGLGVQFTTRLHIPQLELYRRTSLLIYIKCSLPDH